MSRVLVIGGRPASLHKSRARGPLLEALQARGLEVHVAAAGLSAAPTRTWLEERGIRCHEIPLSRAGLSPLGDLRTLVALYRLMRRVRPDIFLGYNVKPVIWGVLSAWLASVPRRVALITGLGYAFTGEARGRRAMIRLIVRGLYQQALHRATLVIFQNPDDPADLVRAGVLRPDARIEIVNGSGVDITAFTLAPLPDGALRFLLIARLLGDKGIREYTAAAVELRRQYPELEFHLVGGLDPNPDGITRDELVRWHARGDISWHGPLEDVRPAIAAAHVFVLPSYREGTPRSILEAMSMGRPIITTDTPGCRQTVEEGVNGFLVPPRDADALARAMERFVHDPTLVERMGTAARLIAEEHYDVQKVNARMLSAMNI